MASSNESNDANTQQENRADIVRVLDSTQHNAMAEAIPISIASRNKSNDANTQQENRADIVRILDSTDTLVNAMNCDVNNVYRIFSEYRIAAVNQSAQLDQLLVSHNEEKEEKERFARENRHLLQIIEFNGYLPTQSLPHPDPSQFSGDVKLLPSFLKEMAVKLKMNEDWYPSEQKRMGYFLSRLTGRALAYIQRRVQENGTIDCKNVATIITLLREAFGDIDETRTASSKILTLVQGTRSLASFLLEWQETAGRSKFNDQALITLLHKALHEDIVGLLSYIPPEDIRTDLTGFISQVRRIDNTLRGLNPNYHKRANKPVMPTTPAYTPPPTFATLLPRPKEETL